MKFINLLEVFDQLDSALAGIGKHSAWSIVWCVCLDLGWIGIYNNCLKYSIDQIASWVLGWYEIYKIA